MTSLQFKYQFIFTAAEYFLAPRNWDQLYEVGDSRQITIGFLMDSPDEKAARERLIANSRAEDIELTGIKLVSKTEWPVTDPVQRPIATFPPGCCDPAKLIPKPGIDIRQYLSDLALSDEI